MTQPLYLVELNEINFEFVDHYAKRGHLPSFFRLIQECGVGTTTSEAKYENIEPWIQWVSAHTGKSYAEHKVFRLGDIVSSNVEQIWETLERKGITVGAVSPMNAVNRLKSPSFFIPDPWTASPVSADGPTRALYRAVRQAVGDNAGGRLTIQSLTGLTLGFLSHVPAGRWRRYFDLVVRARKRPWLRAVILDELMGDVFLSLLARHNPQFATLFVNAGAHIQHHYLFNSPAYKGSRRNPTWYVPEGEDPVLEIYAAYDRLLGRLVQFKPSARIVIATGLHQVAYPEETYYWRLKNHEEFLGWAGMPFRSIEPLMSRDFVVRCDSSEDAGKAMALLSKARIEGDLQPVFTTDNRGDSIFSTLVFKGDIEPGRVISINGRRTEFSEQVIFVALKNAHHNGLGYLIDTAKSTAQERLPLTSIFSSVTEHFGLDSPA